MKQTSVLLLFASLVATGPAAAEDHLARPSRDSDFGLGSAHELRIDPELTKLDLLAHAADSQLVVAQMKLEPPDQPSEPDGEKRLRSWELPPVTVVGQAPAALKEEERIGSYNQPRWTATRRFPTTRVYVRPEGKVEFETWGRGTFEDGDSEWRILQEIEVGLPHRFQLDLYMREDYSTDGDETKVGAQFEIRYALADWDVIFGNPTLYFEYVALDDRPDKIEPKILFGGEITERWHWGANLVGEFELTGEQEHEYQITGAVSRTIIDSKFQIGTEAIFSFTNVQHDRDNFHESYVIGPSFQLKPLEPLTINVSPLIGLTDDSPDVQLWTNIGWEF